MTALRKRRPNADCQKAGYHILEAHNLCKTQRRAPKTPPLSSLNKAEISVSDNSIDIILEHSESGAALRRRFFSEQAAHIANMAMTVAAAMAKGNKIMLCGNGGSAADAQHLAGEFVNRMLIDRPPLPAVALSTDTSVLTAVGNDFGYDLVFAKQVAAISRPGDVLLGISTSGNSANVIKAMEEARCRGVLTIGFTGRGGGGMRPLCDMILDVPENRTPLVQEIHIAAGHLLCILADYYLFENAAALAPHLEQNKAPEK